MGKLIKMAKDYAKIGKLGWTCVQGKLGILCSRNKRPCDSVSFNKNEVLIVDASSCKTKVTDTNRRHTICKFKPTR